jgi:PhnB protein
MTVQPIPEGYHSVTPYLIVEGAAKLIEFAKSAFGAEVRGRMEEPGGAIMHAEITIGDSMIMLADSMGAENPPMPTMLHVYVNDVDATYRSALAAGGASEREPTDQFYGDRSAAVKDAFGNRWYIATHVEDVSPEEMEKRAAAAAPPS